MIAQQSMRQLLVQFALLASSLTIGGAWRSAPSLAQIVPDQTLGAETTRVSPNVTVDHLPAELIEGGAVRGSTLFHSFQDFNVAEFQRVYFANPNGIETILSRVTGSGASSILGTLGVTGAADLFLLNPNGIVFGPNAQLDVAGSFMASTADRFILGENQVFSAVAPHAPPLLTVNVTPGLQYGATQQGMIQNQAQLRVGTGENLTLLGDTVIHQGGLTALQGTVEILGNYVSLEDQAQVDTSGAGGGGTVRIGGAFQGQGAVPTALRTYIGPDVQIRADAIATGNGGDVTVWADEITGFYGSISAQGAEFGQGGLVEVSGHQHLIFRGAVNTSALNGQMGTLLLDPTDITIASGAGDSGADGTNTFAGNSSATPGAILSTPLSAVNDTAPTTIFESELENLSGNTNVILQATNNIAIADLADNALTFSAGSGTIQFTADADQDGAGSVFANDLSDRIVTNGRDFSASGASITLGRINTSRNGGSGGDIALTATGAINTRSLQTASQNAAGDGAGGDITVDAGTDITIADNFTGPGTYGLIQTRSQNAGGSGSGGTVTLNAGRDISISATTTVNRDDAEQTNLTTRLFDTAVDDTGGNSLGGDVNLSAERDVNIASTTTVNSVEDNNNREDIRITARTELFNTSADDPGALGNSVGGDISVVAGRNLNIDAQQTVATTIQGGRVDVVAIAPNLTAISTAANGGDNGLTVGQVRAGNVDLQATGGNINVNLTNTQTTRFENVSVLEGRIDLQPRIEVINASSRNAQDESTSLDSTGGTVRLDAGGDINLTLDHSSLAELTNGSVLNNDDGYRMGVETRLVNASAQGANAQSTGEDVQGGEIQLTPDGDLNVSVRNQADTQFEGANIVRNNGDDDVGVRVFTTGFNASATGANNNSTNQSITGGNITVAPGGNANISVTHIANQSLNPSNTTSRIDDFTVESTVANLFNVSAAGAGEASSSDAVQGGSIQIQPSNNIQLNIQHNLTNTLNTVEIVDVFEVDPDVDNLFNASARRQIGDERSIATGRVTGGSIQASSPGDFNIGINASVANNLSDTTILRNIFDPTRNNALQIDIDSSIINASGRGAGDNGNGSDIQGGEIDLNVAGDLDIQAQYSSSFSGIPIQELQIETDHTVLDAGASRSDRNSTGGTIDLQIGGNLVINANVQTVQLNGTNVTDQVDIDSDEPTISLTVSADENVRSRSLNGTAGNITVNTQGSMWIDGEVRALADENGGSSIAGDIYLNAGGDITLASDIRTDAEDADDSGEAGTITLISGGQINTQSIIARSEETGESGAGGNVYLRAEDDIRTGDIQTFSRLDVSTDTGLIGNGGDITLISENGTVFLDGVNVRADALGNGDGGVITIQGNAVEVTNGTEVRTTAAGTGGSGRIDVQADDYIRLDSGRLFTFVDLGATADGGDITLMANTVTLDNYSFIDTATFGTGDAGDVAIRAGNIQLNGDSSIFSITAGEGSAGDIMLNAGSTGTVALRDRSSVSTAVNATSTGTNSDGGDVEIRTGSLSVSGGAQILALTRGVGQAGDVDINAADTVEISSIAEVSGVGAGSYRSGIFTSSDGSNSGAGGNITVESSTMRVSDGGVLSAQTSSQSDGGDIVIDVQNLELHNGGQLITSTTGAGDAGDITVNATGEVLITGSNSALGNLTTPELPRSNVAINESPAASISEGTADNNSIENAVSLDDALFSLDSGTTNPNVELSNRIPYVSITGQLSNPNGNSATADIDYYKFEVTAGTRAIFDVDTESDRGALIDLEIQLFDASGQQIFSVNDIDDSPFYQGAGGSVPQGTDNTQSDSVDPYGRFVFTEPGTYYLSIGVRDDPQRSFTSQSYQLQVSLDTPNVVGVANVTEEGSGLFAQTTGAGAAGNVTLNTVRLTVNDGGRILASTGASGRGGNVTVDAGGDVAISDGSQIAASTTSSGRGGRVNIAADRNVSIANNSQVAASTTSSGRGGTVDITADGNVSIATNSRVSASTTGAGAGGNVTVGAGGGVSVRNNSRVSASTTGAGAGGNVDVTANEGVAIANNSRISASTESSGRGGNVTVDAGADVAIRNNSQISASTTDRGDGGSIIVDAGRAIALADNSQVSVQASGAGRAGSVELTAPQVGLTNQSQVTAIAGATNTASAGGSITVNAAQIDLQGNRTRITTATEGSVPAGALTIAPNHNQSALAINLADEASISASTSGSGQGGSLRITAPESITISGNGQIEASTSGAGDAGDVRLRSQQITVQDGANITASTSGAGAGGDLTVSAAEAITIQNNSQLAASSTRRNSGNAGNVRLQTQYLTVQDGANVTASTAGAGAGGSLTAIASEAITIGRNSQLAASTRGDGNAGDVRLRSQQITVQDGANVTASTSGAGAGGSLAVNASEAITIQSNSQLEASTSGAGNAGGVALNTQRLSLFNNSSVSASTSGTGIGGSLTVIAPESVSLDQGSALSVEATDGGFVAGNLDIITGEMRVSNGSQVTVSSPEGRAGNLSILANRLFLDNGELTALTAVDAPGRQSGANITLGSQANSLELLFLENESLILASALGDADGGNITIFADFVIATNPTGPEGSDIVANAVEGTGGEIRITTKGLFGIEFRDERTPDNDITVSSQFGLSGTFIQNDLGIDPSRGLTDLPLNLTDPAGLIDRSCNIASTEQASEFVVTGRGGLPPAPNERIDSDILLDDLGPSETASDAVSRSSTHQSHQSTAAVPEMIVEPQQWVVDDQGRMQLVAAVSNADHVEGAIAVNGACVGNGEEGL